MTTTKSSGSSGSASGGRRDRRRLLLASIVLLGGIAGAAMVVSAAGNVQIENVSVSPETPVTGETVTVETTIANLASSNETVEITDLYVRTSGDLDEHARIQDIGAIDPGGSVTVPVSTTFDSPGEKRLTVRAVTRGESGGYQRYEYPLYLDVEEPSVRAGLSTSTPDNSTDRTAVELTNYGNTDLTDVEIRATVDGDVVDRKFTFDVEPGSSETVRFHNGNVTANEVTFLARYDAAGERHTTEQVASVGESSGVPGEIHLTRLNVGPGAGGTTIQGEAVNLGSTDAGAVMLRVQDGASNGSGSASGEYFIGPIDGSEFATFEMTADIAEDREVVPVEVSYNVDGERRTKVQQIDVDASQSGGPSAGPSQGANEPAGPGGAGPGGVSGPGGMPAGPGGPGSSGGLPLVPMAIVGVLLVGGFIWYRWRNQ